MKNILYILSLFTVAIIQQACSNTKSDDSLEGKKSLLAEKKKEMAQLQASIDSLSAQIANLDPSLQIRPKYVSTEEIKLSDFERFVDIQGNVIADESVNAVSEVGGRILRLTVKEGDAVRKGQIIATIDMESVDKVIAEIETSLTLARDIYERQQRLWSQGIGSEVQYLQAKNSVERLEKNLETTKFQLTKATIYAPISGVVDREMLKQGEVASPGMPIVLILNTNKLKVNADLPERYLTIAKKGLMLDLYYPALNLSGKGRIIQMARSIDPANRTLAIEIQPLDHQSQLKPNLLVEMRIPEINIKNVVQIGSENILQEVDGDQFVYIASNKEGKYYATKRYISTGEKTSGAVIVTNGLSENELLVTTGTRNVSDGELLEIIN